MDIRLISHASVIITSDVSIWTDPWLQGKAFNDSWSLFPEPAMQDAFYETIDYLFISHEHPDHLHFPTLKALPEAFRERVTILYQENNSDKVFKALQRLGFSKMITLPHDKVIGLTENTKVYCYQAGSMDSALAVITPEGTILNLNDCEVNQKDCRRMKRSLGNIRVVLNQFSIAGYSGFKERDKYLPAQARNVLEKMLSNHRDLEAEVTIPFASFIYFSSEDNRYINEYGNKPADAYKFFAKNGQKMDVLYPGDLYEVGSEHDSDPALKRFDDAYSEEMYLPFDVSDTVPLEKISSAFDKLSAELHDRFPKTLLRFLKPVVVEIPDLDKTIIFSIRDRSLSETENADPDLIIKSQPLYFGFSFPYGIQTLGVSARYILNKNFPNWRNHRILFSMNNAEIYLKPRHLFSKKNLAFFRDRLPGAMNQFLYRLKVMR
ncbi:MAG: MBL fold metallo-hydrolase [Acidobacteria bacterium]|nr:MBL fold metallo-hydrolase [Acidobacteriota bacterium]